ncbi:MFS transporter [Paenarthrobacter sp. NPDC090520]|uniref:MFS transporter n=1 Tax=Paenarthrobacter sp. NPDC090520 TaxID=3364382 RepID=UPI0037F9C069
MSSAQQSSVVVVGPRAIPSKRITAGLGGGVALEWYDWNIYGLMAAFLAPHFFPSENPVTSTLSALAVFGAGFIARPLGAVVLGPVADRVSHKRVMLLAVGAMSATSLIIGILPTFETLGVSAGVVLLILRLVQGMATGAEAGVANAVAIELAPENARGRYLGLVNGTFLQVGIVGSGVVAFAVSAMVPSGTMAEWGWRIPFLIGGVLGVVVVFLRSSLPETLFAAVDHKQDQLHEIKATTGGVWKALWQVRLALAAVVLVIGAITVANYAWITGLPAVANSVYKENPTGVFGVLVAMGLLWIVAGPLVGRLSDRFGSPRVFVIVRLLLIPSVFSVLLYTEPGLGTYAMVMIVGGLAVGLNMGLYNYIATTLMPKSARTTGVALGYALAAAIFGGTASYLVVFLRQNDLFWVFPVYVAVLSLLSVIVYRLAVKRGHLYIDQ